MLGRFLGLVAVALLVAAPACDQPRAEAQTAAVPSGPAMPDSLLLVNRTDTAFAYLAFHPMMARPLSQQIEVDLSDPRSSYIAAGDAAALWPCREEDEYVGYTLHLYRVAPAPSDSARTTARLARSITLTADRLAAAREEDCRLVVDAL